MMHQKLHQSLAILFIAALAGVANAQEKAAFLEPFSADEIEAYGIRVSDKPSRELPGYRPLKRMLVLGTPPAIAAVLREAAPDVEFVAMNGFPESGFPPGQYEAVVGGNSTRGAFLAAEGAAWIHAYSAGVDKLVAIDWIAKQQPIVTNSSGTAATAIAEHAITLMMMHARQTHRFRDSQLASRWDRGASDNDPWQVGGKTMLVLGLGSIGTQIAQRADALGMRVIAVRNSRREGPEYIDYVGLSDEMLGLAAQADVVVNALPLTPVTQGVIDRDFFKAMKPTAIIINIGRGGTINTRDLMDAMNDNEIAGAGLDVTDPEPLPADHPLWSMPDVIITPHVAGRGMSYELRIRLLIENIRRYQAGEPLLNPIDIEKGY
jgi:phosphoglycerate dehydrogenase-like enzyme